MKAKLAVTAAVTATLAAILLPAPAASAVEVKCVDNNFVAVSYHRAPGREWPMMKCFAGGGWNHIPDTSSSGEIDHIWMDSLRTGNNDITYRDCNGTFVDYPRGYIITFSSGICITDIGIRPY